MKKIVHLTSVHPMTDVRIFQKECVSLKKAGFLVKLITQAEKDTCIDGIEIIAVHKTNSRIKRMSVVVWQMFFKALRENADIYHFHDPELIIVGLMLRLFGKKVVYDIHEDVPRDILLKTWIKPFLRKIIAGAFEIFEDFAAKYFSAIVTVTPHLSKRFNARNFIEVRNYPILAHQKINNLKNNAICYAGQINMHRGFFEMVKAAQGTNTNLFLAGDFSSPTIKKEALTFDFVKYYGNLNRKQLDEFYGESSIGLALLHPGPTFNDSLPIKIFEYMAAGLPVIASDFPLWRDIIEKHGCGFCVDPFDNALITQKIFFLKNNPEQALEMGKCGRNAVEKYYNWSTEFIKLESLYHSLLF